MRLSRILAVLLALGLPAMLAAQGMQVAFGTSQTDPNAPVEVTADALSVSQTDGKAVFEGNVLIAQSDMRLAAPLVEVIYLEDNSGIARLLASGGVTIVSGQDAAEAQSADYDVESGVVVLQGSVLLTQGPNTLTSERMSINLETGTAQMAGRVKTVLNPGTDQ